MPFDPYLARSGLSDYPARGGFATPSYPATSPNPSFTLNPGPQGGQGAFGAVPGPIGLPPVLQDLQSVYPNLTGTTAQASQNILSQLRGELSPETLANIEDENARFGISSGMPGSGLQRNRLGKNIGLSTEALQQQGLGNFLNAIPTVSKTMTVDPNLQAEIAARNALFGSAPNPQAAADELLRRFQQGIRGGGGGGSVNYPGFGGVRGGVGGMPAASTPFGYQGGPVTVGYGRDQPSRGAPTYGFPGLNWGHQAADVSLPFGNEFGTDEDWSWFNDPSIWGEDTSQFGPLPPTDGGDGMGDFEDIFAPDFGGNFGLGDDMGDYGE